MTFAADDADGDAGCENCVALLLATGRWGTEVSWPGPSLPKEKCLITQSTLLTSYLLVFLPFRNSIADKRCTWSKASLKREDRGIPVLMSSPSSPRILANHKHSLSSTSLQHLLSKQKHLVFSTVVGRAVCLARLLCSDPLLPPSQQRRGFKFSITRSVTSSTSPVQAKWCQTLNPP